MKNYIRYSLLIFGLAAMGLVSCQKGNLAANPNVASTNSTVPVSLIFNRIVNEMYNGGGVMDGVSGEVSEIPFSQVMRWNQFFVSNYSYYWGGNSYNWSNTATMYSMLKYIELMEQQTATQYPVAPQPYTALAKFFRAYLFVWYTQRVGDIPMTDAGTSSLTPTYNTQHDVYKNSLALLDTANTLMATYISQAGSTKTVGGDIYGLTALQWQKVINTYKLRVLISLSRRATDNADLNIPSQFATIVNTPTTYPIMTSISDNLQYTYNAAYNKYPIDPNYTPYDFFENVCGTFLNITTSTQDPRTFIAATPAPNAITGGKLVTDFTAYVGADIDTTQSELLIASGNNHKGEGAYSFHNYLRYYTTAVSTVSSPTSAEPDMIIGYPEMCFNIAEAANRGWISGVSGSSWYTKGIMGSMAVYGLSDGVVVPIGDEYGNSLGSVTVSVSNFLANANVLYAGDNATGLTQILTQKYVAFWQNSGWEAYYNWRRTGVPTFQQGGPGIGTANSQIPIRWQYPTDEQSYNTTNYQSAIQSQFGGTDAITSTMWLTK